MVRSSMVKVAAAFVAGLVVALASALLYVRAHERAPVAEQAAVVAQETPQPEVTPAPAPAPAAAPAPEPAPAPATAEDQTKPVPARRSVKSAETPRKMVQHVAAVRPPAAPVQVVENEANPIASPVASAQADPPATTPPATPAPAAALPEPHRVELATGTNLTIRLGETISTQHNYSGDAFRGTLDQPVVRDGFIIADKGSKVLGKIVESDKAGRIRGVASLTLKLMEINTTDGQRIEVETNSVEKQGMTSKGEDTAKIAGGAALGAIIGALGGGGKGAAIGAGAGGAAGTGVVLATRGKAAVLPSESRLTFVLASPVTITEQLNH